MKHAYRKCPLCDHDQVDGLHFQRFVLPEGHPLSDGYEVVCCQRCGFVYADTAVSQEAYDRFYAQYSKYEDFKTGTGGVENVWDLQRQEETARQISKYLKNPLLSILDVGCANGGLLKSLKDLGCVNVFGIDPSAVCVENARKLGVDAEIGSLFQPLDHAPFDCIVLSHTLEHVQDLKRAASWISTVAKKNSVIYVEVPDASRYKDYVDSPFQDFNTEHINHFSIINLKNYLTLNGVEPVAWGEKIIPASTKNFYPAIFCFAKKTSVASKIEKDGSLRNHIEAYITQSRSILDEISSRLDVVLSKNRHVIVWGTGQLAMKLLIETSLAHAEIIAFVDSNPINQGKTIRGVKVLSPEEILTFSEPILISSTLHQQSIAEQIGKMGLENQLILLKEG